ncbi:collagenase-like [Anticarsia gemmatalis]|uniref:collagenase-like n=1 Tax=Anticarsia gemmatalis TaxID=129554 RepID=UPI003F7721CE
MKLIVSTACIALALVAFAEGLPSVNSPDYDYHRRFGIPRATELKKLEEGIQAGRTQRIPVPPIIDISQVPYQAGLVIQVSTFTSVCGATLISQNRLLTASGCQDDGYYVADGMTVVLGSNFVFFGGLRIFTRDIHIYPNPTIGPNQNDIAIIRLTGFVPLSNVIQPITLPYGLEDYDFVGWTALVSGFLQTYNDDGVRERQRLRASNLTIISKEACSDLGLWVDTSICAVNTGGWGFTDHGGPLAVLMGNTRVLIGIPTYTSGFGIYPGEPIAYTRVSRFLDWIQSFE